MPSSAVLLITCPDAKGLVASVSNALYQAGANIMHADQHQDHDEQLFFMRVEWRTGEDSGFDMRTFRSAFETIAERFSMRWQIHEQGTKPRIALMVSQHLHCLADLLQRYSAGELPCEIATIVSNHRDGARLAEFYGVPFVHTPMTLATRPEVEREQIAMLQEAGVELVVLARYMQILSGAFVSAFPMRVINVHHSFLPAFIGAKPYHAAHKRGVKLIGATSHYATEDLDEGPIIAQDVTRISHRDTVQDLIARGRDLERVVLSRAVRWHLDRRIVTYGNKTVIFD